MARQAPSNTSSEPSAMPALRTAVVPASATPQAPIEQP